MSWQQGKGRLLEELEKELHKRLTPDLSATLVAFAQQYYGTYPSEDMKAWQLTDIYGAVNDRWAFLQSRTVNEAKVRVINPDFMREGWQCSHTVVEILSTDMPFIVDSIRGELNRHNITIHTMHSAVLPIVRDKTGKLQTLLTSRDAAEVENSGEETLFCIEIGRVTDKQKLAELKDSLCQILSEVALVVGDFTAMAERSQLAVKAIKENKDLVANWQESVEFLEWISIRKFTFLAYVQLQVNYDSDKPTVSRVKNSELGLLKCKDLISETDLYNDINNYSASELLEQQIVFSKSSVRSRIHRLVYPDYIRVKYYDAQGRVSGEHRFLGLYTSQVYTISPSNIPLIRRKIEAVKKRSQLNESTHAGRDFTRVLEVFPRDELFQSSVDELYATTHAVNNIQERRQVRLFVRRDPSGRFVNCLVYTPRDIYRTELRGKIQALLCDAFNAQESEFTTFFSESILTRTHFVLRVDPELEDNVDIKDLEEEVVHVTMTWQDHLGNYLIDEFGEEEGSSLNGIYANAFSPGYMHDFKPRVAINDIKKIKSLRAGASNGSDAITMSFYRAVEDSEQTVRVRLFHLGKPIPLSDVIPILEHLGLRVESEHPYEVHCSDGQDIWVHEFKLTHSLSVQVDFELAGEVFQLAFSKIWHRDAESDSFNRLILGAGLGWRQIAMLRAYSRYMKQIRFNFSGEYIADTLSNYFHITRKIVDLFNERFDCSKNTVELERRDTKSETELQLEQSIIDDLEQVGNLGEDRIIRQYLALINATLRTNYFQKDDAGELKAYFSFKLFPSMIPDVPLPVPMYEIFVYSPSIEGVHLRGGKVARGGLRWSDRMEDFRTEVLGLVKAQQVKNAVIVPTGAKGGFVAKKLPAMKDRSQMLTEGIRCYKIFIQALLDLTDNLKSGEIVPPVDVVRKDEDDSYLVVAADKGTATFSDIANKLSIQYDFWLGDAFASGGSAGYDHKKMGITAKGAWVSVQRHFREMGTNIQEEDFTVVGVGDMGGDVFGNGMLLSKHIQLICAFNHLHIFIDPNPDSAASFVERKRLFELQGSSWEDYDSKLISEGGGIFLRSSKSIKISTQMNERFDIDANSLTPNELIKMILKARADLFWNGGIGTYVKSSAESHADVGDKANDVLRVDGNELRFKVLGEGGNLGVTQLSRIEFALNGGRSNTDFIDNAAGVDCSDHEVNIKILLNGVIAKGDMTDKQRNLLLEDMTENISLMVLENNYRQTQAISLAERDSVNRFGEHRRLIHGLEASGRLNRQLEFLPDDEALQERINSGSGLTRPELSVLISYMKSQLKEQLADSNIVDDEYLLKTAETAFPDRLRTDFNDDIHTHRLRREIVSTQLANDMVNNMGLTFVDRMGQSTGVDSGDIVRAYVTSRDVFGMPGFLKQIESLDYIVSSEVQMELIAMLMRLVRRGSRWFIRNRRVLIEPAIEIANFEVSVSQLRASLPEFISKRFDARRRDRCVYFVSNGVPVELATAVASAAESYPFLGIIEAAKSMEQPVERVANLYFSLSERLELDWFSGQISDLKIENQWQAMARESYRDDLEWQQRALTVASMRHICEAGDIEACLDRWMDHQHLLVARWRLMLVDLQNSKTHEFAMFSVAIRELLDLAQSSKFEEVEAVI